VISSEPSGGSNLPNVNASRLSAPSLLPPIGAKNRRDRFYRDLKSAMEEENLTAPCYLYAHDIGHGLQVRAIGAPLPSDVAENAGGRQQARFPLFSLAW
jgi:hypothetical protein